MKKAIVATYVVMFVSLIFLLSQLNFLIPYKRVLYSHYGLAISMFFACLFLNLTAVFYYGFAVLGLQHTGTKGKLTATQQIPEED
jgi:hypothetical protein